MNPQSLKVEVVYNCPTAAFGESHYKLACEFVATLHKFPAGYKHKFVVVSNGGKPDLKTECLFAPFGTEFFDRANIGKDIGSLQHYSSQSKADLMLWFGGSTYIRGANWLRRVVDSFLKYGEGLYGSMSNSGDQRFDVSPHIRTTGFWIPPKLLNLYPMKVVSDEQRYPFEHGPNSLTMWVSKQGLGCWTVTWDNCYEMTLWNKIPNGFHRGNQEGVLFGDHLSKPPHFHCP